MDINPGTAVAIRLVLASLHVEIKEKQDIIKKYYEEADSPTATMVFANLHNIYTDVLDTIETYHSKFKI